ncbi:MAG TPA: hypothetical protein VF739_02710 [Ktedonobacterales bacterium]
MSYKQTWRASSPTGLILVLLALVALLGLLTGFLTHLLVVRAQSGAQLHISSTQSPHTTASNTSTPVPITGVTGTATVPAAGQFLLSVDINPKTMTPGEQITITVHAFSPDTHDPISGLPCVLRAPTDGSPALFSSWPPAQTTDSSGSATWTLTAPQKPAGIYEVEAFARASKWSYKLDSSATVRAG